MSSTAAPPASARSLYLAFGFTTLVLCTIGLRTFSHFNTELANLRGYIARLESTTNSGGNAGAEVAIPTHYDKAKQMVSLGIDSPAYAALGPSPPAKPSAWKAAAANDERDITKGTYGGKGDPAHLGGFTLNDTQGQSPLLWEYLLKVVNVRSVVDLGCGRGISTKWFMDHKADVLCVEGSHDAVLNSLLPRDKIVEHDFAAGPWWPEKTYDLAWSVEFLEHVGRQYIHNYINVFKQSAVIFATHSLWGGFHHVETHPEAQNWWWRSRFQAQGFVYSEALTQHFRAIALKGSTQDMTGQHIWLNGEVYINPRVASLPQHRHIFGGPGCWSHGNKQVPCAPPDDLPNAYRPVWAGRSRQEGMESEDAKAMTGQATYKP